MMASGGPLDRFRSPSLSSRHRKGRSSSECIRKSDGITLTNSRAPAVRIFVMNDGLDENEELPPQKTPRDQIEDEPTEEAPGSLGRIWRRKSVNIGSPLPGPQTQAKSFYDFVGVIGEGKTSQVYYGVHKKSGEKVAIKVIDRRRIVANPDLIAEVSVLKKLSHPNIISLKDVFITLDNLQIVMELCEGHELFDEIVDRRTFQEVDARDLIRQILEPLAYLHAQGIAHRDLKPENIMFVHDNDTKHIKLLDFGFAKVVDVAHPEVSMVGTLGYKAPEIFNKEPYSTQCDMWALGVIAYILLCGFPPFFSQEHYKDMVNNAPFWFFFNDETDTLVDQIKAGAVKFPDSHWSKLSPQAKSFVQSLLTVDPVDRMTAEAALHHPWMTWKPSPFYRAELAIKNIPAALERLRHGGKHRRQISGMWSFKALDGVANTVEKHILGDSATRGLSISQDWEVTDVDDADETLIDVKYRLLASDDTQEAQLEMLSAIDQPTLRTYLHQRKNSLDSRMSRPSKLKHFRKASF